MAWDKSRPYFPISEYSGQVDDYDYGHTPSNDDIDEMYEHGEAFVGTRYTDKAKRFIPFREVRLRLSMYKITTGRSSCKAWWRDGDGHVYPMFSEEFNRMVGEHGVLSMPIDGYWSAMKRGANYGITLARLADEKEND